MKTRGSEQARAGRISAAVDALIRDPGATPLPLEPGDEEALAAARQLARLPALLGPVDPALEERIWRCQAEKAVPGRATGPSAVVTRSRLALPWVVAALSTLLLVIALVTPFGQTAVASFRAVFTLGRAELRITPVDSAGTLRATAEARAMAIPRRFTLQEASRSVAFAVLQPTYLPAGYNLESVTGYVYPELPAWVPQPFSLELVYADGHGHRVCLQLFPIRLGEGNQLSTSALSVEAAQVYDVRQVEINGRPGALLRLGTRPGQGTLRELVWEQNDLILSISTSDLSEEELLRVADSVQ